MTEDPGGLSLCVSRSSPLGLEGRAALAGTFQGGKQSGKVPATYKYLQVLNEVQLG